MWHHQHIIEPTNEGVQMTDIVSYRLPLGILGRIAHGLFIRAKIESIFNYRQDILDAKFN
jgi:ligand-binding SRPBCC domain-containing protein